MWEPRGDDGAIPIGDLAALRPVVDGFLGGRRPLTGLELYYELERATPLLTFHTMIRQGPQNRAANGLQQSYGDHNRLLMLGLDKLVEGDLTWYRSRLDGTGDVTDDDLQSCLDRAANLALTPEIVLAFWLAGALHDCGMLCGRGSYVDVEDGVVLSRDVIEALCPAGLTSLALFVLRHHDYIKDVFLGEVPASLVADDLEQLAPDLRPLALAALGLVQVAGAASLGEGRLGQFRIGIFQRCLDGSALDDRSSLTRLSRLLRSHDGAAVPSTEIASSALRGLGSEDRDSLERMLECTPVHGWHRGAASTDTAAKVPMLLNIAEVANSGMRPDHIVLVEGGGSTRWETTLSGSQLLVLDLTSL